MDYLKEYKKWCEGDAFDKETKTELLKIKDDEKEKNLHSVVKLQKNYCNY